MQWMDMQLWWGVIADDNTSSSVTNCVANRGAQRDEKDHVIDRPYAWWRVFGEIFSVEGCFSFGCVPSMTYLLGATHSNADSFDLSSFNSNYGTCYRHQFNHRVRRSRNYDLSNKSWYIQPRTVLLNALTVGSLWFSCDVLFARDALFARIVPLITDPQTLNVCNVGGCSALWLAIASGFVLTAKALLERVPADVELYSEFYFDHDNPQDDTRPRPIASVVVDLITSHKHESRQQHLVPIVHAIKAAKDRHAVYHDSICLLMHEKLSSSSRLNRDGAVHLPNELCNIIRDYIQPPSPAVLKLEAALSVYDRLLNDSKSIGSIPVNYSE